MPRLSVLFLPDQAESTHLIRKIRMIISVLPPPAGIARFADFLARIVPKLRCDNIDFDGFVALNFNVL